MFRIALKGILARKVRLLLTSLAVVAGTAFLAGTFIFSDTLRKTFDDLFADVYEDVDAYVQSTNSIEVQFGPEEIEKIPGTLVATIEGLPGVEDAQPFVQQFALIIGADGKPLGSGGNGPPTFGGTVNEGELGFWNFEQGRPPAGPTEVALDRASAADGEFSLGDTIKISAVAGTREFTLVGVANYGEIRSPGGATFALFDEVTAAEFVNGKPDAYDAILVRGDGSVNQTELADTVESALAGTETETLTGKEITEKTQSEIRQALSFFTVFLTIFAFIALFVATFVIYNLFSITVAQRRRENALLRAVGASRGQVTRALLVEALVMGVVGSILGLIAGLGLAVGLRGLLNSFGLEVPSSGLILKPATIVVTLIVGTVVTVLSAILPGIRSGRVPPVAAMRDDAVESTAFSRGRLITGVILAGLGAAGVLFALFAKEAGPLGFATLALFIGLFVLGPLFARPMARLLGRPIVAARGVTGRIASQNAERNPKRTARTAAALVVGAALVTGVTVMASSVKASIREIFGRQFTGEIAVTTENFGFGGLPIGLAAQLAELPEIETASGIGVQPALIGDEKKANFITVIDPRTVTGVFDLKVLEGSIADLLPSEAAVSRKRADKEGWSLGSPVRLTLRSGDVLELPVAAIYAQEELAGPISVSKQLFLDAGGSVFDFGVFATPAEGFTEAQAIAAAKAVTLEVAPEGKVQGREEYIDEQVKQIDPILGLMYGLLMLSVIIAIIGIVITLLLSVHERRRELGLVRAIGMSRAQTRSSVRWESVIVTLFGAIEGVLVGVFLGFAVVKSLESQGLQVFKLPVVGIVSILVLATLIGVAAAWLPARRASRLNILDAIATS